MLIAWCRLGVASYGTVDNMSLTFMFMSHVELSQQRLSFENEEEIRSAGGRPLRLKQRTNINSGFFEGRLGNPHGDYILIPSLQITLHGQCQTIPMA